MSDLNYTKEDLNLLEYMLKDAGKKSNIIPDATGDILKAIEHIMRGEDQLEHALYTRQMSKKEKEEYKLYEPFGEPTYFVIMSFAGDLSFNFYKRHLIRLLRADLSEMPLLMNTELVGVIANWRLKIGK